MTTVLMAAILTGCSNDDLPDLSRSNDELKLTASVDVRTRATATAFEVGDCIGVYAMAWTDASPSVQTPLVAPYYAGNVKFKWEEGGFVNQQTAIYWPVKTRKLDLYAYYPYSENGIAEDNTLSIAVQTDQSIAGNYTKSDYMTARLTGNERTKEALILPFKHVMSKLKFTLIPGNGYTATELSQLNLMLKQMNTTALLNLSKASGEEGFMTALDNPGDMKVTSSREAIVVPQTKNVGDTFFTLSNADGTVLVTCNTEEGKNSFETGKQYNYTVKISRVGVNLTAEITDWEIVDFAETNHSQIIDITTNIGGTEGDKAETFADNDVIGIFQKNGESMAVTNRSFVWKSGGLTGDQLYWPDNGTKVTMYGYYPYTAGLTSTSLSAKVAQDQQTAAALTTSDVKTAVLATDKSTTGNVILSFNHAFSKIVVKLVKGEGFTDAEIAGMSVTLPQMKITAAIDLTKKSGEENYILTVGDEKDITPFSSNVSKTAIVVPQTKSVGSDLFAIKTVAGVSVVNCKAEAKRNVFESGKQYTYTIKLNRVNMRVNAEIANWAVTSFEGEAEQAMDLTADIGGVEGEKSETFALNDKIGLYANYGGESVGNNLAYTWGAGGLTGESTLYWPDHGTVVNLYAYYPYKPSGVESSTMKIKAELPANQETDAAYQGADMKTALLTGIDKFTNGKVILPFYHAFSRVNVKLVAGIGFTADNLKGCKVVIEDMYKETLVDISKKITDQDYLTAQAGSQTIQMNPVKGAIIIPKTVSVGTVMFTVTDREGNKMAIGKAASGKNTFTSGNQYDITLTLNKAAIGVSAEITDWTVNNVDMSGDQWLN